MGSGDGVVCVELAKRLGVAARGVELNPWLVDYSRYSAWRAGVGELCTFERGDLFKARVSGRGRRRAVRRPGDDGGSREKARAGVAADARVLAARFPLATWTETRHDVHTSSRAAGYNVNQLWEYELDPLSERRGAVVVAAAIRMLLYPRRDGFCALEIFCQLPANWRMAAPFEADAPGISYLGSKSPAGIAAVALIPQPQKIAALQTMLLRRRPANAPHNCSIMSSQQSTPTAHATPLASPGEASQRHQGSCALRR